MKTAHNEHRAAHLQNHGMEPMQAAEDVKKEKLMNKTWIKNKKMLGIGVAMLAVVGISLGLKFGLPYLE